MQSMNMQEKFIVQELQEFRGSGVTGVAGVTDVSTGALPARA